MTAQPLAEFDPDFAGPAEWAAMYRACGLQVVPAKAPIKDGQWKMPALASWTEFQEKLIPQATFDRWYGENGEHFCRQNMGIITGAASGYVFVIDLDIYKTPDAAGWWAGLIAVENNNIDPETVEQRTGGGGLQKLFRYPVGWRAPTRRTPIGVDIRGQGGFAMMARSQHESGREYEWMAGHAPWEIEIAMAPQWLLDAIEALVEAYGGDQGATPKERTPGHSRGQATSPASDYDAFGNYQDGREVVMFRTVWREVLEWYRECPIKPVDWQERAGLAYEVYERRVANRHAGLEKRAGLEKDGRGPSAFWRKWRATMRHWGSPRMVKEAAEPRPHQDAHNHEDEFAEAQEKAKEQAKADPCTGLYERLYVKAIKAMADPAWLIEGLMIEQSLGFIFGPPGSLKTFVALDISLHIACGRASWWGRSMQRRGAVVYICSEGYASMKYRIAAWERHRGVNADDAPFCLIRQNINFMRLEDVAKLLETVQAVADETNAPIVAVLVDTVSRVLPGAEENLQKDMTLFIAACDAVRQRFKATVIGVHHTNAGGGFRGSTVMPAAGDFILETRREPGAMTGSIFAKKVKDAEDGWEDFFAVSKVELSDIAGRTSLCLDKADAPPGPGNGWPAKDVCRRILEAIADAWGKGRPWSPAYQSRSEGRYGPAVMVRSFEEVGGLELAKEMIEVWLQNEVLAYETYDLHTKAKGLRVIGSIS